MVWFMPNDFDDGHSDQKLSVGIAVAILEGGVIAFLGGLTVLCALLIPLIEVAPCVRCGKEPPDDDAPSIRQCPAVSQ